MGKAARFGSQGSEEAKRIIDNKKFQNIVTNVQNLYGFDTPPATATKGISEGSDKSRLSKKGGQIFGALAFAQNQTVILNGTTALHENNNTPNIARSYLRLIPENFVSDTLNNITGLKYDGQVLIISNGQSGTTITLTDAAGGAGQFACPDSTDYALAYPNSVILIDDPQFGVQTWRVIGPAPAAGSGINNIVEDTTPQLGGNLDLNGKRINMAVGERLYFDDTLETYMTGSTTDGRINVFNEGSNITSFGNFGLLTTNITCSSITTSGQIDVNGNLIVLDSDGDTKIYSSSDDNIQFMTGASVRAAISNSGLLMVTPITMTGANINMGSNDIDFAAGGTIDFTDQDGTAKSSGGAAALPANPTSYFKVKFAGATRWIPYYST